jgi:hypothetical protein
VKKGELSGVVGFKPALPGPPGIKIKVALASFAGYKNVDVGVDEMNIELSFCSTDINCAYPGNTSNIDINAK